MIQKSISTRRIFLQRGMDLLAASTIPAFLNQTVMALSNTADNSLIQQPSGKDDKILVVVQLGGGNAGLSTASPVGDDACHRARPVIGLAHNSVLKIDNYLGLHPNLAPLKSLY